MNTSRKRHRDGAGVAAPEPCCDVGQKLSGGGGVAFRKLLDAAYSVVFPRSTPLNVNKKKRT